MKRRNITINDAQIIAERAISEIIANAEELQGYEFGPVKFRRESDRFWVFSAASEKLIEEGYVPGAVFATVDKADGHVWSIKEQERYAQSLSPIPPPPRPVSADGKMMMDIEDGLAIARREISEIIENSEELRGYKFSPARLRRWNDRCWVFSAASERLIEEGSDRGEIFVCIDPFDGHVLSAEEQERLGQGLNPLRQASQPDSIAA